MRRDELGFLLGFWKAAAVESHFKLLLYNKSNSSFFFFYEIIDFCFVFQTGRLSSGREEKKNCVFCPLRWIENYSAKKIKGRKKKIGSIINKRRTLRC